jgi:hypothetical protein
MEPLDLTRQPPRSCFEELDGLMLMPRTIDKLRGFLPGGNPAEYFINGKTPGLSQYLLDRLGIALEDLQEIVARAADEEEIAEWLRARTDVSQYPAINATLQRIKPKHAHDPQYFAEIYAHTLALHPQLEHIVDIIDADDRRVFGTVS